MSQIFDFPDLDSASIGKIWGNHIVVPMSSNLWVQMTMYRHLAHWRWRQQQQQQQNEMWFESVCRAQNGKNRKRTHSEMNEVELY